jgi:mRNA-degrading endonuclease RelE of RelBE toxin-antitoxin system
MRYRVELSTEAQKQLVRFPRDVRERMEHAIDELEEKDDSQWSNIKALQGPAWKGRYRKTVGPYRIIFRKYPERGALEVSAVLIKSKDTYRSSR